MPSGGVSGERLWTPRAIGYTLAMAMIDNSRVRTEFDDGVVVGVIKISKITDADTGALQEDLIAAASPHGWKLALDMSEVLLLASVGISMLLTLRKQAEANGGRVALYGVTPDVASMLKITKLSTLFKVGPDRKNAVESIA